MGCSLNKGVSRGLLSKYSLELLDTYINGISRTLSNILSCTITIVGPLSTDDLATHPEKDQLDSIFDMITRKHACKKQNIS